MKAKKFNRNNFDPYGERNVEDLKVLEVFVAKDGTPVKRRVSKASKFRDGQVLPTKTLVKRMLNGSIVDNLLEGQYAGGTHDSQDIEAVERMDLVDKVDMMLRNHDYLEEVEIELKSYVETKKEKAKALEEKKELAEKTAFEKSIQEAIDKKKD